MSAELTCVESQIDGLLGGLGASEDHDDVLKFLRVDCNLNDEIAKRVHLAIVNAERPIKMVLHCPACGLQHIDEDNSDELRIEAAERGFTHGSKDWEAFIEKNEWTNPPHRSHLCHGCGHIWRPADVPTEGVASIQTRGKADSDPVAPAQRDDTYTGRAAAIRECRDMFMQGSVSWQLLDEKMTAESHP